MEAIHLQFHALHGKRIGEQIGDQGTQGRRSRDHIVNRRESGLAKRTVDRAENLIDLKRRVSKVVEGEPIRKPAFESTFYHSDPYS